MRSNPFRKKGTLILFILILSVTTLSGCSERIKNIKNIKNITSLIPKPKDIEEVHEMDPFSKVSINVLTADFSVRRGSSYQVKVIRKKKYKLSINQKGHELTIQDAKIGQKGTASIEVLIPLDAELKLINGSTDVGQVHLNQIKAKKAELYCGVGNCTVKKCDIQKITANGDTGEIRFIALTGMKDTALNLSVEEGNVYIEDNARGSVFARKKGARYISSHMESGDIHIQSKAPKKPKATKKDKKENTKKKSKSDADTKKSDQKQKSDKDEKAEKTEKTEKTEKIEKSDKEK